jgi:hypothetical protein
MDIAYLVKLSGRKELFADELRQISELTGTGYVYRNGDGTYVTSTVGVGPHASTHAPGQSDALPWATIHDYDTIANRPLATSANAGYLYFASDQDGGTLYRSNGTIWQTIASGLQANVAWSRITGTPTTVAGYGITDVYTKTEVDNLVTGFDPKEAVHAATTAPITLSGDVW